MKTIKTLSLIFEKIAENHPSLNSYSFGPLYDISTTETNYSLLLFVPGEEETIDGINILNTKIYLMDLKKEDNSNNIDVVAELQSTKNDIIGLFSQISRDYNYYIYDNVITTFTSGFDDLLIVLEIDLKIQYDNKSGCLIPVFEPERTLSCSYTQPKGRYKSLDIPITLKLENFDTERISYINKSIVDENTNCLTVDYAGSDSEYIYDGNGVFRFINHHANTYVTYPRLRIPPQENIIINSRYWRLRFHYKKINGFIPNMRVRIGETVTTDYIVVTFDDDEGDIDITFKSNGLPNINYINFLFFHDTTVGIFELEFSNYSMDLVEYNIQIQKVLIDTSKNKSFHTFRTDTSGSYSNEIDNGVRITCMDNPSVSTIGQSFTTSVERIEYSNKRNNIETTNNYTLKYHYKKLDGDVDKMYWRIGEFSNLYSGYYNIPGEEGDVEISIDGYIANNNHNYIRIYFEAGKMFDVEITNIKLIQTDFNSLIDYDGSFGYNEYKVIDIDGTEYVCENLIEVPEPLPGLMISVDNLEISAPAPEGKNAMLSRIYYKPGDVYVNWGNYFYKHSSAGTSTLTKYNNYKEPGTKVVDVYGDGFNGFHFVDGSNTILDFSWFLNKDLGTDNIKNLYNYYNGIFFGNIENMQLDFYGKSFYSYYFSKMNGDISKSTIIQAKYFRFYNDAGPYVNFHYTDYGIQLYGDVGTMLKGYSTGGNYSKSYFDLYRVGTFTYQDRIDAPIKIDTRIMIMGYGTNQGYWAMRFPDELCQLIIDLDTWRVGTIPRIDIRYNTPLTSSPLYADFVTAKNNMIADGTVFVM